MTLDAAKRLFETAGLKSDDLYGRGQQARLPR